MIRPQRNYIILFGFLGVLSLYFTFQLNFGFSLEQFFPEGDEDLEYYREFVEEFGTDVNFVMVAIQRNEGVFEKKFLNEVHEFTIKSRSLPHTIESTSLTTISYPLKTPFAITTVPAIHRNNPKKYEKDKFRILADERFAGSLISDNGDALVVALKTEDILDLDASAELVNAIDTLATKYDFDNYYLLGPAYFQKEMVRMQKREVTISAIYSGILVAIILFWIFRRLRGILIALVSIGLGLLLFFGLIGLTGRELNAMSALYPVLMIIVGTSDVIHIMSKYIDELRKGFDKETAIQTTIREIGLATLLTSLTTAVGFATLMTSRVIPIQDFGMNAAIGVVIAYITVIFFTTSLLIMFGTDQLMKIGKAQFFWENLMEKAYRVTRDRQGSILVGAIIVTGLCFWGISLVSTNFSVHSNLPTGEKITEDFHFFEKELVGFRPLEIAVYAQGDFLADDYEVLKEVNKLENYLRTLNTLGGVNSLTSVYKSINQMEKGNRRSAYKMPNSEKTFNRYKKLTNKIPGNSINALLSKDQKKTRITSRILDLGADSIKIVSEDISRWIAANSNSEIVRYKQTGTGLILDKNAEYIRRSLIGGLGIAILIVSLLMALLFRNVKMVIISLVPNVFPLLMAGALLGFLGIELDAAISIVFAVIFGIAVDDTIHFLSKYKLSRNNGKSVEDSLHITFLETGKAICLTSLILFFGFLVMLFSIHPPSVNIGLLISLTLVSAIVSDLFLIPPMIRWLDKDEIVEISKTPVNAEG